MTFEVCTCDFGAICDRSKNSCRCPCSDCRPDTTRRLNQVGGCACKLSPPPEEVLIELCGFHAKYCIFRVYEAAPSAIGINVLRHAPAGTVQLTQPQRDEILRELDAQQPPPVKPCRAGDAVNDKASTVGDYPGSRGEVALAEAALALRMAPGEAGEIFARFVDEGIALDKQGRETLLAAAFVLGVEVGRPKLSAPVRAALESIIRTLKE